MQHAINWFEIPVADLPRAIKFYEAMSSTQLQLAPYGSPGEEMAVFPLESREAVNGCLVHSAQFKPSSTGTMVYLSALPNVSAWLDRVESAGGKIITPRTALPEGMGFFAHIQDSEGNRVGLHAMA